jgi:uncharacterized membrane protein YqjE
VTRLRRLASAIVAAVSAPLRAVARVDDPEQALAAQYLVGLALLAAGLALVSVPAALAVTGAVVLAIARGFALGHPITSAVAVASVAAVLVALILAEVP